VRREGGRQHGIAWGKSEPHAQALSSWASAAQLSRPGGSSRQHCRTEPRAALHCSSRQCSGDWAGQKAPAVPATHLCQGNVDGLAAHHATVHLSHRAGGLLCGGAAGRWGWWGWGWGGESASVGGDSGFHTPHADRCARCQQNLLQAACQQAAQCALPRPLTGGGEADEAKAAPLARGVDHHLGAGDGAKLQGRAGRAGMVRKEAGRAGGGGKGGSCCGRARAAARSSQAFS
jgi:hypothetical protein